MRKNTIKWRIFKGNLIVIILLILMATIIFNVTIHLYMEKDILQQLDKIASHAEHAALLQGPEFFPKPDIPQSNKLLPLPPDILNTLTTDELYNIQENIDLYRFYFMLDRSLREPLSVLNADYILLDKSQKIIPLPVEYYETSADIINEITNQINKTGDNKQTYFDLQLSGMDYIAFVKPVSQNNSFDLGWIVIYSSIQKINELTFQINIILLVILVISALILILFSSIVSKKISAPFSSLNEHIRAIAERNFSSKIQMPVDDEMQELVNNINKMSEKLETYDKAQKIFLQNISHEFRTPLMSIQSYAEGITHNVIDSNAAADIIVDESKRLTHLVEDLLYLSRLDSIEENYCFSQLDLIKLIDDCIKRMNGIAMKKNIKLNLNSSIENINIFADGEKLSRAITNIISNCIRYANTSVEVVIKYYDIKKIELIIFDDGMGFEIDELSNIFERYYKGKKGNLGLGLAISKNVIEKHNGNIIAQNSKLGAMFKIQLPFD